jgi:hypothetical protein
MTQHDHVQTHARRLLGGRLIAYRYQSMGGFLRSRWHLTWTKGTR